MKKKGSFLSNLKLYLSTGTVYFRHIYLKLIGRYIKRFNIWLQVLYLERVKKQMKYYLNKSVSWCREEILEEPVYKNLLVGLFFCLAAALVYYLYNVFYY